MRVLILFSMFVSMTAGAVGGGAQGTGGVGPRPMLMSFTPGTEVMMMNGGASDVFWYHSLRKQGALVRVPAAFDSKDRWDAQTMPTLSPYVMSRVELVKARALYFDGSVAFVHKAMGESQGTNVYLEATKAQEMSELHEAAVYMSAETGGSWIVINHEEGSF